MINTTTPSLSEARQILKKYWGYDDFRPGQKALIEALLSGRDVLGIMPTGAGKSICYEVPALLFPGTTIIVSPLISLMEDQVGALKKKGIDAVSINSLHPMSALFSGKAASSHFSVSQIHNNASQPLTASSHNTAPLIRNNASQPPAAFSPPKILYVSPERLSSAAFQKYIADISVSFFCVDEAHCISKWGHDFRPDYLKIHDFLHFLQSMGLDPRIAAFTATADRQIRREILEELHLRSPYVLTTGFDRPNLFFAVEHPSDRQKALLHHLARHPGECGIVYCITRKTVVRVTAALKRAGVTAEAYHAGMTGEQRTAVQNDFLAGKIPVIVATNAFGMGIDKPDVRFVIHYNMPKDMESYYQEAGRAGRDGFPAECILFYNAKDVKTGHLFIDRNIRTNPGRLRRSAHEKKIFAHKKAEREKLRSMLYYAAGRVCLRAFMLEYFGEHAPSYCGKCSVCLPGTLPVDAEQRKMLRHGTSLRVPSPPGRTTPSMPSPPGRTTPSVPSPPGRTTPSVLPPHSRITLSIASPPGPTTLSEREYELYRRLLACRKRLADDRRISAEKIFPDDILRRFCSVLPDSLFSMCFIDGISVLHVVRYGREFLEEILAYRYFTGL